MRIGLFVLLSVAVVLGCSDDDTGSGGSAGMGGAAGGSGGMGGDGGAGGGQVDVRRAFILYTPEPPCAEGTPSNYRVDLIGDFDILDGVRGSSDQCESFTVTDSSESFECENDGPSIPYTLILDDGEEVETSGTFATCQGFFTVVGPSQAPPTRPPFLDLYIVPDAPCQEGVESTYTVQVLVDTFPAAVDNLSLSLSGCTGSTEEGTNTYTCSNAEPGLEYSLAAGEGDTAIQINGVLQTCSAFVFTQLQ